MTHGQGLFRRRAVEAYRRRASGKQALSLMPLCRHRRVPVLLQATLADCGPACLAMVLGAFGRHVTVKELREEVRAFRDGSSAAALVQLAERYGLRAEGFSAEISDLRFLPLPAILHWRFNHFVVLEKLKPRGAVIVDPASGRRWAPREELEEAFTGVALAFEPTEAFVADGARARPWRRYLSLALEARGVLARVFSLSLLLQVFGLAAPVFTALVVDRVLPRGELSALAMLGLGATVVMLSFFAVTLLRGGLLVRLQAHLDEALMVRFLDHLLRLPFPFFQLRTSGDLLMRLASTSVVRDIVAQQLLSLVLDGLLVLGYLLAMVLTAPALTAVVALVGGLQLLVGLLAARPLRRLTDAEVQTQAESHSFLVELLRGVDTVKAFAAEGEFFKRWRGLFREHLLASVRRQRASNVVNAANALLAMGAPMVVLLVGAAAVMRGTLSLGTVLGFGTVAAAFLAPLGNVVANLQRVQLAGVHLQRLEEVLVEAPEPTGRRRPGRLLGGVVFEDVSFCYSAAGPPVLEGVNLTIEPGEFVVITGPSGAGKSTLAKLLLGFYRPTSGRVLVDGLDLAELDIKELRREIGVVLQGGFVFSSSLKENITLGHPYLSLEEVEAALHAADLSDVLSLMPLGLETRLSEAASNISGGQRQRVAIARALAGNPRLVLFDEATSELDAESERRIYSYLSTLGVTRIVIAHRLSVLHNADRIVLVSGGRVVAAGKHQELVEENGLYRRLVYASEEAVASRGVS